MNYQVYVSTFSLVGRAADSYSVLRWFEPNSRHHGMMYSGGMGNADTVRNRRWETSMRDGASSVFQSWVQIPSCISSSNAKQSIYMWL